MAGRQRFGDTLDGFRCGEFGDSLEGFFAVGIAVSQRLRKVDSGHDLNCGRNEQGTVEKSIFEFRLPGGIQVPFEERRPPRMPCHVPIMEQRRFRDPSGFFFAATMRYREPPMMIASVGVMAMIGSPGASRIGATSMVPSASLEREIVCSKPFARRKMAVSEKGIAES
jgi:hypothetical protein